MFIVLKIWGLDVNPLGDSKISTLPNELDDNLTLITPWSPVNFPVSGSIITRSGSSVYFAPPLVICISVIESELINVIVGDNLASGWSVLSEWKS